jgi:hypothetical protein
MVSTFQNISSKKVYKDITVNQGLDLIQSGKFKSEVNKARQYERKSKEYIDIKSKIPCITWASLIEEERNLNNVKELSGFIYLDFDNQDVEVDEYTYAQWKSLSGQGCGKLIKVDNLTKENFKSTLEFLLDNYDTADKLNDMCRLNILSSDKDLYYNDKSVSIKAVEPKIVEYKPLLITVDVDSEKYMIDSCNFAYNIAKKKGHKFTSGDMHNSAVCFLGSANQLGVDKYYALNYLNSIMPSKLNEWRANDIYKRYSHQFRNLLLNVK